MFSRILVAIDGSTSSERILLFAEHLARVESAQLVVVHAYQLPEVYEWTDAFEGLREQYEATVAEVVRDALEVLHAPDSADESAPLTDVRRGAAADVILAASATHHADLIVMGGRSNRARAAELLLGSVANSVLRRSLCPVLVVP